MQRPKAAFILDLIRARNQRSTGTDLFSCGVFAPRRENVHCQWTSRGPAIGRSVEADAMRVIRRLSNYPVVVLAHPKADLDFARWNAVSVGRLICVTAPSTALL